MVLLGRTLDRSIPFARHPNNLAGLLTRLPVVIKQVDCQAPALSELAPASFEQDPRRTQKDWRM